MRLFGALSLKGVTACTTLDGAADTDAMVAFVEQVLTPTLHNVLESIAAGDPSG